MEASYAGKQGVASAFVMTVDVKRQSWFMVRLVMMPQISYLTLMNGFVNISLIVMAATVVINLIVGAADKKGHSRRGDRIDRCSRVGFPLIYFGLLSAALLVAFL